MDTLTIWPDKGQEKFIAQILLSLADYANQVQVVSRPNTGFIVPVELGDKFVQLMANEPHSDPVPVEETIAPKPAKRAYNKKATPKKEDE